MEIKEEIKVLRKIPYKRFELITIKNDEHAIQKEVDGYFTVLYLDDKSLIMLNEDGIWSRLDPNIEINGKTLFGTILIAGYSGPELTDCPELLVKKLLKR